MINPLRHLALVLLAGLFTPPLHAEDDGIARRVSLPPLAGASPDPSFGPDAVVVNRGNLVHTRQFLASGTAEDRFGLPGLIAELESLCQSHQLELAQVAKLNLYVDTTQEGVLSAVHEVLADTWSTEAGPALTLIHSGLPGGAMVAADAIIAAPAGGGSETLSITPDSATLPAHRDILQVSGRAARSGTLEEATRETMAQLLRVIAEAGSGPSDVVQVKTFLQPMEQWEHAKKAIEEAFGEHPVPPIVIVEWTSSLPTEIEMIAATPNRAETTETVTFFTPEGDKPSPVFSRVARVHADQVIFVSGIPTASNETAFEETKRVFARLHDVTTSAGSDLRHLAKATYYVSDDQFSKQLNEVRPHVYDPERPPAASKVEVSSTGNGASKMVMDFIAVPAAP